MSRRDPNTRDMFEVPQPAPKMPGSMDYRLVVCGLVGDLLEGHDRLQVAKHVTELTGREVTSYMLSAYCAPSRIDYNAPAFLMPALEAVTDSYVYSNWLAATRGGRLMIGRDALAAELGRIQREKAELAATERALKEQLRRGV